MSFIFEADILIPRWYRERRLYELDEATMSEVLDGLTTEQNFMSINVADLHDLLMNAGPTSVAVKLAGKEDEVTTLLKTIAASAWKKHVPCELEEADFERNGDGQFDQFIRAYIPPRKILKT
jgi:hypothetical protein